MSCTDDTIKESIVNLFTEDSSLQIVAATVTFRMGINSFNVCQVIHFGAPNDVESYMQETGCCGCSDLPSLTTLVKKTLKRR